MAEHLELDTKVSPDGRVVIPMEVRRALEVRSGGRVRFVLDDGQVRLVSPRTLAAELWANNQGGNAGDSVADVRAARVHDREVEAQEATRIEADLHSAAAQDLRSDDEVTAELLAALGLTR